MVAAKSVLILFFVFCMVIIIYYFVNRKQHASFHSLGMVDFLQTLESSLREKGFFVAFKRGGEIEVDKDGEGSKELAEAFNELVKKVRRDRDTWDMISLRNHSIFFIIWLMSFVLAMILLTS